MSTPPTAQPGPSLSAAQAAQQHNRDARGRYGEKQHTAPGAAAALTPSQPDLSADLIDMDRAALLATPEARHVPKAWVDALEDEQIRAYILDLRTRRADLAAQQAAEAEAKVAEAARRRAYRRPAWLSLENTPSGRVYRTDEGYWGREIESRADGRTRTSYLITSPDGARTGEVDRVEEMVQWIEADRAEHGS